MVVAVAELTQQNQDLTREVHKKTHHRHRCVGQEEPRWNPEKMRAESSVEWKDQSMSTITQKVPHVEKEVDQMKIAMRQIRDSMRGRARIDDLIHRTNSPFTASITTYPLPSKFKMLTLDSYDGTRNPCDHIATFNSIMCRAFPIILKGLTRVWFNKLPPNTIASF